MVSCGRFLFRLKYACVRIAESSQRFTINIFYCSSLFFNKKKYMTVGQIPLDDACRRTLHIRTRTNQLHTFIIRN